jgi:Glycosyltransferase family 87
VGTLGTRSGWARRCAAIAAIVCIALVTCVWTAGLVHRAASQHALGDDFTTSVWNSGRAVLDGRSPLRHYSVDGHDGGSVYPPVANVVTLPFALPPYQVARAAWLLCLLGAVVASLWVCGVRDWRCYLAAGASPPVIAGIAYGNVSILLVLVLALTWRWRDRAWLVGPLLGLAIAMKLFLWPLAVWLAITRRRLVLGVTVASAGILTLVGWAVIGFAGIWDYPAMLHRHAVENDQAGVSVAALAAQLGLPGNQAIALIAGAAALLTAWHVRTNAVGAFAWATTAVLMASPMVWWHYFALLLVPIALARPAWGWIWLSPYAMFPQALDAVVGIIVATGVALAATRAGRIPTARVEQSEESAKPSRRGRLVPQVDVAA